MIDFPGTRPPPHGATAPHPVLTDYYGKASERLSFVRRLFDDTAPHYDGINRLFSFGTGASYRRRCLIDAGLKPRHRVIDIATGTGLVALEARGIVGNDENVVGLDLSRSMLAVARRKMNIPLVQGTADQLPFDDGSADFVTMGYALRHVSDLVATFTEFRRILRPGGTVLILEIARPANPLTRAALAAYLGRVVPLLSLVATAQSRTRTLLRYYWDTIENCVSPDVILRSLREAGLGDIRTTSQFQLLRSYAAKKS
jgi:demethylmenaquinone methyltransferase/2-methoxy-6-polyprenyl-1,4-benzoquinol methylase